MLARAVKAVLGVPFHHPWIDLAVLLPALFPGAEATTLDDWLGHFRLAGAERHHALADAFATAQLLQIVLDAADRVGMRTAADLSPSSARRSGSASDDHGRAAALGAGLSAWYGESQILHGVDFDVRPAKW